MELTPWRDLRWACQWPVLEPGPQDRSWCGDAVPPSHLNTKINAQPLLSSQTLYQFQTVQTKLDNFKHFLGRFLFPLGYWGSYSSTLQIKSNSEYNLIWLNISPQTEAMVHQTEWNRKSDMKLQRPTGNRNVAECEPNIEIWTNTVITSQTSEEKLSQELIQSIQIVGSKYKNEF